MRRTRLIGAVLLMLTVVACASTGGGAAGAASVSSPLGTAPRVELDNTVRQILTRNLYVLEREALETNMLYETRWRVRQPFDDERALGATSAESRIIVRARPRSREADIYAATMVVENRLRMEGGEWTELPATREFSAYARSIASELSRELAQGIRVR